jgi:hypothetical protein
VIDVPEPAIPPEAGYEFDEDDPHERPCLDDEGKTAVLGGLVMSSMTFLTLTLFTGRNPRRKATAPIPQAA